MATKRKPAKKSRKTARRKAKPTKKLVKKAKSSRKSATRNKPAQSKAAAKTKRRAKKTTSSKTASSGTKSARRQSPAGSARTFSRDLRGEDSAGQSGDLQGLSNRERADSESVDELLEEGNSFEAGVVEGVEEAGENEGSEVHTHEVPEDDVPGEYLDDE